MTQSRQGKVATALMATSQTSLWKGPPSEVALLGLDPVVPQIVDTIATEELDPVSITQRPVSASAASCGIWCWHAHEHLNLNRKRTYCNIEKSLLHSNLALHAARSTPVVKRARFDGDAFYAALDAERQARQCTWRRVADESGVSASTLSRISQGKRPDVDSLAALSAWSGLDVDKFVRGDLSKVEPEPLAIISSCLRSDPRLSKDAAVALDQIIKAAYKSMSRTEEQQ